MGWNELEILQESQLTRGIENGEHAYFVQSYAAKLENDNKLIATCDYDVKIPAIVGSDNIFGTQFHPEKSAETGLKLIRNFLKI